MLDGSGTVTVNTTGDKGAPAMEKTLSVEYPGAYQLVEHERHTQGVAHPGDRHRRGVPCDVLHTGSRLSRRE